MPRPDDRPPSDAGRELPGAHGLLVRPTAPTQEDLATCIPPRARRQFAGVGDPRRATFGRPLDAVTATVEAVGAERVGIRLSPDSGVRGAHDADELYPALLSALVPLGLAYVHVVAPADDDLLVALRAVWPGVLIVNPTGSLDGPWTDRADVERRLARGANLISFGRAFISNPDLVDRMQRRLPLAGHDRDHWYSGGDVGYLGFPSHRDDVR